MINDLRIEAAHALRPTHSDAAKLLSIEYLDRARYRDAVAFILPPPAP